MCVLWMSAQDVCVQVSHAPCGLTEHFLAHTENTGYPAPGLRLESVLSGIHTKIVFLTFKDIFFLYQERRWRRGQQEVAKFLVFQGVHW